MKFSSSSVPHCHCSYPWLWIFSVVIPFISEIVVVVVSGQVRTIKWLRVSWNALKYHWSFVWCTVHTHPSRNWILLYYLSAWGSSIIRALCGIFEHLLISSVMGGFGSDSRAFFHSKCHVEKVTKSVPPLDPTRVLQVVGTLRELTTRTSLQVVKICLVDCVY